MYEPNVVSKIPKILEIIANATPPSNVSIPAAPEPLLEFNNSFSPPPKTKNQKPIKIPNIVPVKPK